MAKVYVYSSPRGVALSNEQKSDLSIEFEFDMDNPPFMGQYVDIYLYNDKFIFPEDATGLFYGAINTAFNDMDKWDTSECTNMSYLFAECRNLKNSDTTEWYNPEHHYDEYCSFEIGGFDTSNVTNMSHMFYNCISLDHISTYGWDTTKVTDMSYMFGSGNGQTYHTYEYLDMRDLTTSNVTNMEGMFMGCQFVNDPYNGIDCSNFDTSNVTNMSHMFALTGSGVIFDGFDTSKVTDMNSMFSGSRMGVIDVSDFETAQADCSNMFSFCSRLQYLTLGTFDLSSTTSIVDMFRDCEQLVSIEADPGTNWGNYSQFSPEDEVFYGCYNLPNFDGDITYRKANNTIPGSYFNVGPKPWSNCIIYIRV